ncbi:MAG: RAMP superfamily CRISPR-associated protein [Chloroflexota bacterium]
MIEIDLHLTFSTPPNIGSGAQVNTFADRAFIKDRDGWPYIPATTLKGQLRHAAEKVARGLNIGHTVCVTHQDMCRDETICAVCNIFGSPWLPGRLRFVDLALTEPDVGQRERKKRSISPHRLSQQRYGVAISRRRKVAEDAHLYTTELFLPGVPLLFSGTLSGDIASQDAALVVAAANLLPALGRSKSTGLGHLTAATTTRIDGQETTATTLHSLLNDEVPS